ncbi:MAG: leucine zipper domain-containing protein [Thermoanaerobaculales bacterium]|nr:leucine zipper domain-containing protein [Thermoanaerobaculales bacterium]
MTEHEQRRLVNHRLAVLPHAEEVTGNVARTCRYYGISRQAFYKWLRRYEEQGLEGLRDRSSRPHQSPNATDAEVVGKIRYLRQSYHFGPHKIAMYLKRYHDISKLSRMHQHGNSASTPGIIAAWAVAGA